MWQDCCEDCRTRGQFNALSHHFRGKRSSKHSFHDESPLRTKRSPTRSSSLMNAFHADNLTLSSKAASAKADSPANDFQDFVTGIQKTITDLQNQIKTLEARLSKSGCTDGKARERSNNEKWKEDSCTTCICKEGQLTCFVETCPPASCSNPVKMEGMCCPVCTRQDENS